MITLRPYYSPNMCQIMPALTVTCCCCDDEACGTVHGFAVSVQWGWWGIELEWIFP